jgi:hypothetical protein
VSFEVPCSVKITIELLIDVVISGCVKSAEAFAAPTIVVPENGFAASEASTKGVRTADVEPVPPEIVIVLLAVPEVARFHHTCPEPFVAAA